MNRIAAHDDELLAYATQRFAEDGYHPSAAGCAVWGQGLAAGMRERLNPVSPDRVVRAN